MNLFCRAFSWIFGNGYDLSKDEDTVVRHKEGAKECMKESETHFFLMREKFNDMTPDPDAQEETVDEHPSTGRCFGL